MIGKRFYAFLFLLSGALQLQAQVDSIRLDTLTIQRQRSSPITSLMPVQVLNAQQLDATGGVHVADALRGFAGVQIRDYGGLGGLKTLDVRNMSGQHTGILYNGMTISNAQNGLVDLGRFSLDNLSAIRLYNGQPTDLALPARAFASASVLALETAKPALDIPHPVIRAGLQAGSFGLFNPSIRWQQPLAAKTAMLISGEWMQADGQYPYRQALGLAKDTTVYRQNSDIQSLRLEAVWHGFLDSATQWSVHSYLYFSERGLPGPSIDNKYNTADRQWDDDAFLQARLQKQWSSVYRTSLNAKYSYNALRYLDPDAATTSGYIKNAYFQHEYYLSAAQIGQWNRALQSALTVDYSYQQLDANLPQFAYPRRHTLWANAASRWQADRFSIQANVLATLWHEQIQSGPSVSGKPIFSPSISVSWKPFDQPNMHIRAFYKSIFRMPTFNDRYYTLVGSASLRPEYTDQYNIGLAWETGTDALYSLRITADVYHNVIKDRITAIPTSNIFRWTMVNLGRVEAQGLDISLAAHRVLSERSTVSAGGNYSFQHARDITVGSYNYKQIIPYAPTHSGSAYLSWQYGCWDMAFHVIYTGSRYSQRANLPENILPSWLTQDISVSYRGRIRSLSYKIKGTVNNLADRDFALIPNYPMPGRQCRIGVQINL